MAPHKSAAALAETGAELTSPDDKDALIAELQRRVELADARAAQAEGMLPPERVIEEWPGMFYAVNPASGGKVLQRVCADPAALEKLKADTGYEWHDHPAKATAA